MRATDNFRQHLSWSKDQPLCLPLTFSFSAPATFVLPSGTVYDTTSGTSASSGTPTPSLRGVPRAALTASQRCPDACPPCRRRVLSRARRPSRPRASGKPPSPRCAQHRVAATRFSSARARPRRPPSTSGTVECSTTGMSMARGSPMPSPSGAPSTQRWTAVKLSRVAVHAACRAAPPRGHRVRILHEFGIAVGLARLHTTPTHPPPAPR